MAYYTYKQVREQLPDWLIEAMGTDYDGDANYDGDQWAATSSYIDFLIRRIIELGGNIRPSEKDIEIVRQENS
jgi:hypothetical protein